MNRACVFAWALGLTLAAGPALAQTSWKASCTNSGTGIAETLGDAHALTTPSAICIYEGGPLDGAVATQNGIWENVKGTSTMVSSDGVARKPGGLAVYRLTGGTLAPITKDGRQVGWTASGTGVYALAVGEGAPLKGKLFTWTARATGPRTYIVDVKVD